MFITARISTLTLSSLLVSGTVLLTAQQAAHAERDQNRAEIKAFRQQFRDARKMFNQERKNGGPALNPVVFEGKPAGWYGEQQRAIGFNTDKVRNQSMQLKSEGNTIRLKTGVDLDLSSHSRNITLGKNLFNSSASVTIEVGGQSKTVSAGSQVSAAEYIAVKQVLSGSQQKISIDAGGKAIGGEVDLSAITSDGDVMRAASLVVADNVTTYGDFGKRSDFRLLGNLDNYGTVHALSSDSNVKGGAIRANDINNHAGALISSEVDLTLYASGNLNNAGTINSLGNLTLSAGDAVNNSGKISANNITLAAPGELQVNNEGGTMRANGAINVRTADYTGAFNSTIRGGDFLSADMNLNSGTGLVSVVCNDLTGTIHETGAAAQVLASTDVLRIGNVCLTGDPTFYNTLGSIEFTADVVVNEALVVVAATDITASAPLTIQAGDANTTGFNITLIAGADFTPNGGDDSFTLPAPPENAGAVSLSGKASGTGGSIRLGENGLVNVLARPTAYGAGDQGGGNIQMFAFAGKQAGSGIIDIQNAVLASHGFGAGNNGDITLVAGASNTASILVGQLNTFGGSGTPGDVNIITAQPVSSNKKIPVDFSAAGVPGGSTLVPSTKLSKVADVVVNDVSGVGIINASGNVEINASNLISVEDVDVQSVFGDIDLNAGTDIFFLNGGLNSFIGDASLNAHKGQVFINGVVQAAGSIMINAGANIETQNAGTDFVMATQIFLSAGQAITGGDGFHVNTPDLSATAGTVAAITALGGGNLIVNDLSAKEAVFLDAPNRTVGGSFASKSTIELDVFDIGGFEIFGIKDTFALRTTNAAGNAFEGGFFGFQNLVLDIAAGIGTVVNPLEIEKIGNVDATSSNAGVFLANTGKKTVDLVVDATTSNVQSLGSVILSKVDISNGDFMLNVDGKSINVNGNVDVAVGDIALTTAGKIVFAPNVTMATNSAGASGTITLTAGGAGEPADNQGPFPNVTIMETGAQVVINAPGLKASAPDNILTAKGATLTIDALKAKNFALGGGVQITADPPVPAGTPTFVTAGPVELRSRNQAGIVFSQTQPTAPHTMPSAATHTTPFRIQTNDSVLNLITVNSARKARFDDSVATFPATADKESESSLFWIK